MKKALVVGGNSGIGLAVVIRLLERKYEHVYIVGKDEPRISDVSEEYRADFEARTSFKRVNFVNQEYGFCDEIQDIDTLVITAGFGRVAPFESITQAEISNLVKCNMLAAMKIIKSYYDKICSSEDFYCAVMGSIAGHVASPLFSVYGATKFGLCSFIANLNIELEYNNIKNRILDVCSY